jgi:hypothetical protein
MAEIPLMLCQTSINHSMSKSWWSGYHLINVDPCEIVRKEIYGTHTQMSIYCVYNIGCLINICLHCTVAKLVNTYLKCMRSQKVN